MSHRKICKNCISLKVEGNVTKYYVCVKHTKARDAHEKACASYLEKRSLK